MRNRACYCTTTLSTASLPRRLQLKSCREFEGRLERSAMKLSQMLLLLVLLCDVVFAQSPSPDPTQPFHHPRLLHTKADLERIRSKVAAGEEPWKSGFEKLQADKASRA